MEDSCWLAAVCWVHHALWPLLHPRITSLAYLQGSQRRGTQDISSITVLWKRAWCGCADGVHRYCAGCILWQNGVYTAIYELTEKRKRQQSQANFAGRWHPCVYAIVWYQCLAVSDAYVCGLPCHWTRPTFIIRFYLPHILESAGIKEAISALLGNGVGGAVNFIATLFVLFYVSTCLKDLSRWILNAFTHTQIDKWDRRRILVCGALAMSVCMICISIVSAIYNQQLIHKVPVYGVANSTTSTVTDTAASYAILALLCVFIAFFALSW